MTAAPAQDVGEREAFEKWAQETYPQQDDEFFGAEFTLARSRSNPGEYVLLSVQLLWQAWQASGTRLRAELAAMTADRDSWADQADRLREYGVYEPTNKKSETLQECQKWIAEANAANARAEAAEKDAERYRWLRRRTTIGVGMVNIWSNGKGRYDSWQEEELDAAIDAARSKL